MERVQMSTEENNGRRARDRKHKKWREESFGTGKTYSRPAGRRMSASILLSAVLLFMVTGCKAAASPAPGSPQEADVKIRVVCSGGDVKWKNGMETMAEAFMESNNGIKVELYFMPEAENQTYEERLKVLAAQGEFNDIVELRETDALVRAGLLAPMPEKVYSLVENPGTCGGICYGVPGYSTTLGMIYNADIFERLGLSVPHTYEEFLRVCATLKASGYDAIALGAAGNLHMKFWGNYLFCNYIVTGDGQVSWTKEKAVEMLGDFRGLSSRGYINSRYRAVSDRETVRAISARKAVMVYAGPWMLPQIENLNPQIRLGFFFLPGRDGTVYAMDDRSVEWGISSVTAGNEKKMDASVRFLQFYYSEGVYENILERKPSLLTVLLPFMTRCWLRRCGAENQYHPLQKKCWNNGRSHDGEKKEFINPDDHILCAAGRCASCGCRHSAVGPFKGQYGTGGAGRHGAHGELWGQTCRRDGGGIQRPDKIYL